MNVVNLNLGVSLYISIYKALKRSNRELLTGLLEGNASALLCFTLAEEILYRLLFSISVKPLCIAAKLCEEFLRLYAKYYAVYRLKFKRLVVNINDLAKCIS